ncbi:MAG: transcription elongation factor 1 family protein [Candidatus Wukongarchaeota archaeon]|nr:transcription elongation factor 1 family protein [Candidatus Wukongarchaeota archaeon]
MGRRRTRKVVKRPVKTLPSIFVCPRCGEKTVKVEIDRKLNIGKVRCGKCKLEATVEPIRRIDEEVDVYSRWFDSYYASAQY